MKKILEKGLLISGRYEVKGFIGEGGMQEVFCARDIALERDVALKHQRTRLHRRGFKEARR